MDLSLSWLLRLYLIFIFIIQYHFWKLQRKGNLSRPLESVLKAFKCPVPKILRTTNFIDWTCIRLLVLLLSRYPFGSVSWGLLPHQVPKRIGNIRTHYLADAGMEADVAKGRRDWAFSERDKVCPLTFLFNSSPEKT